LVQWHAGSSWDDDFWLIHRQIQPQNIDLRLADGPEKVVVSSPYPLGAAIPTTPDGTSHPSQSNRSIPEKDQIKDPIPVSLDAGVQRNAAQEP